MSLIPKDKNEVVSALAPTGILRAAINFGNAMLASQSSSSGLPSGLSVDLSTELARRLGVPLECICFPAAGKVFDTARSDLWDIAFLALDPDRAKDIDYSAAYVILSGSYAVRIGTPISTNEEVDSKGVHIVVGAGSAYDLYLSRHIRRATIVRAQTSQAVVETMLHGGYEVAAGVRQQLESDLQGRPELRLLSGDFMSIHQAMAVRKGRDLGLHYLRDFVNEMKASGFVQDSLARHGIQGATIA